ncbi:hypothetical protein BS78_09G132100 [Paspalum vaginatum]|nr:hypothetical protein BS78_09G132100 [Paspalum vaginatum]
MAAAAAGACANAGPVVGIVMFQVIFAGLNIFYKLAMADGMDLRVLIAYRYFFASISLAPVAYFIERRNRTKVTWKVLGLSFLSSLCGGSMAQNLYIAGMKLTSATFASATTNLLPAITFILALLFRFERLAITTFSGQAKVAGTLLGVGGAMLLTFYKGVDITPWHSRVDLIATITQRKGGGGGGPHPAEGTNYAMGSLLCVGSSCFYALWLIVQAKLSSIFPFYYSNTALMCIMTTLQSTAFALCFDRDAAQWRLGLNIRLLSVAYAVSCRLLYYYLRSLRVGRGAGAAGVVRAAARAPVRVGVQPADAADGGRAELAAAGGEAAPGHRAGCGAHRHGPLRRDLGQGARGGSCQRGGRQRRAAHRHRQRGGGRTAKRHGSEGLPSIKRSLML